MPFWAKEKGYSYLDFKLEGRQFTGRGEGKNIL